MGSSLQKVAVFSLVGAVACSSSVIQGGSVEGAGGSDDASTGSASSSGMGGAGGGAIVASSAVGTGGSASSATTGGGEGGSGAADCWARQFGGAVTWASVAANPSGELAVAGGFFEHIDFGGGPLMLARSVAES